MQILNRDAAPAYLPYHSAFDNRSWWTSQLIFQMYLAACTPGAVAISSYTVDCTVQAHTNYPNGTCVSRRCCHFFLHHL